MIEAQKVRKEFQGVAALHRIDLLVQQGEFVAIMGPSGSGKSTLLHMLAGIDTPTEGSVLIQKQDLSKLRPKALETLRQRQMGFVFQEYHLLNSLTCGENIILPLTVQKMAKQKIADKLYEMATRLHINELLNKYPYEISGGQRQRVAIARAMIIEPHIIFADEPTGALDSKNAKELLALLSEQQTQTQKTIVLVTHDAFAASFADRILYLRDGKIVGTGTKHKQDTRRVFYDQIMQQIAMLGGESDDWEISV